MSVIVEDVKAGTLAELAGLRRGDRLMTYGGQELTSPAMLLAVEENTFGVERVIMYGERDGRPQEWTLPPGLSGCQVRPELPDSVLAEYDRGREEFQAKRYAEAFQVWNNLAPNVLDRAASAWLYMKSAGAAQASSDFQSGLTVLTAASELLSETMDTAAQSWVWRNLGLCCYDLNQREDALYWFDQALQADEAAGRPLWIARELNDLGDVAWRYGDLVAGRDHLTQALSIAENLKPFSLEAAVSLSGLGVVAMIENDLAAVQDYLLRAMDIRGRHDPASLGAAACLNNLGSVAWRGGNLTGAQGYFAQALEIFDHLVPGSPSVANCLSNLSAVALKRGDVVAAQDYSVRSVDILESLARNSLDHAKSLNGLAIVLIARGQMEAADVFLMRALGHPNVART